MEWAKECYGLLRKGPSQLLLCINTELHLTHWFLSGGGHDPSPEVPQKPIWEPVPVLEPSLEKCQQI